MRRLLPFFLLLILSFSACTSQSEKDREQLNTMRKDFWKDKNNEANNAKATALDSAYKAYVNSNPKDTGNAELLFENAKLHLTALKNTDEALGLLKQLYTNYPQSPRAPEAMYQSAFLLENELHLPDNARKLYQELIDKYPNHPFAKEAQTTIKYVGQNPEEMLKAITDSTNRNKPDTLTAK